MAKKKKKEEIDAALLGAYLPGALPVINSTPLSTMEWYERPPPFSFHIPTPGTSFIDNYLLYFFMPSPLEQVGTILDPFGVQEPPQRYLANPWNLAFDLYWDVKGVQSMWEPGPPRVLGWPPEGYVENAGQSTWDPNTGTVV